MSANSIIQNDGVKKCFFSDMTCGRNGEELEKHHIMNGWLRDWADKEGLWIWVSPEYHRMLHDTSFGVLVQKTLLKPLAQMAWESTHSHEEWMKKVHKNYVRWLRILP